MAASFRQPQQAERRSFKRSTVPILGIHGLAARLAFWAARSPKGDAK